MDIQPPIFELRRERCRCCEGQGELKFSTCPNCGLVVLICAEVGTMFEIRDRRADSVQGDAMTAEDVCVKCCMSRYSDFRSATSDEILALGFQSGDYK